MTTTKGLGRVKRTARGFQWIEFTDYYGEQCSLQASSLAIYDKPGTSAIWLGLGEDRMHLDVEHVEKLVAHLKAWLRKGKFNL